MDDKTQAQLWREKQRRAENRRDWIATILLLVGFGLLYWVLHVELG